MAGPPLPNVVRALLRRRGGPPAPLRGRRVDHAPAFGLAKTTAIRVEGVRQTVRSSVPQHGASGHMRTAHQRWTFGSFVFLAATGIFCLALVFLGTAPYGPINELHMMVSPSFFHALRRANGDIFGACWRSRGAQHLADELASSFMSSNDNANSMNYNSMLIDVCSKVSVNPWLLRGDYETSQRSTPGAAAAFVQTNLPVALLDYVAFYNRKHGTTLTLAAGP